MDEIMDTKVVQMKFDNAQFRAGVQDTIKQLDNLEKSLRLQGASDGLNQISKASKNTVNSMNAVADAVDTVKLSFSYLEVAGVTAMVKLTNAALVYGKKIANNLWSRTIGQAVSGGKVRSQNISNAKFQLEGLGVAWEEIYEDINYGVQDTAYGLDEAAKAAAQLVASQVQLGTEMQTALRGISGTAAMTNSTFSEISDVWTTIASNGKLMTMQLRQLSARGLNASSTIAKYYREIKGVSDATEASINEMVTKGQIGFQDFASAMDWAFGEHAKEANKTFQGALSNMNAALSRIGQKFADPVYENLRIIFNALRYDIDNINRALQPAADMFTKIVNRIGSMGEAILTDEHFTKGLIALAVDAYSYVRVVVAAINDMLPVGFNLRSAFESFETFATSLQLYGDKAERVRDILKDILSAGQIIIEGLKSAFTILKPLGRAFLEAIGVPLEKLELAPGFIYKNRDALIAIMRKISELIALKVTDLIVAIGRAIRAIDWKTVLNALVILINTVSKAILLLPDLIGVVNTIFRTVVAGIVIAGYGVSKFIELVVEGYNTVKTLLGGALGTILTAVGYLNGSTVEIGVAVDSDSVASTTRTTSAVVEEQIAQTDELTDAYKREESAVKAIADQYGKTAVASKEMASEVEKSYSVISKAASDNEAEQERAFNRNQNRYIDPSIVQKNKTKVDGADIFNPKSGIASDKKGIDSLTRSLNEWFGKESGQKKQVKSAMDAWYSSVYDTIKSVGSSWIVKIYTTIQTLSPFAIVIGAMISVAAQVIGPIIMLIIAVKKIFKLLDGLAQSLFAIGTLAKAYERNAKANEIRAIATLLKSTLYPLLGLAALIGAIVAVAYVMDKYNLQEAVDTIFSIVAILGVMIGAITAIAAYIARWNAIKTIMIQLGLISKTIVSATKPAQATRKKDTITSVLLGLAATFASLAAGLMAIVAAVKILGGMKTDELFKGLVAFVGIGALVVAMVAVMAIVSKDLSTSLVAMKGHTLTKKSIAYENLLEENGTAVNKVLWSLAGCIAVITAAVAVFGYMPIDVLKRGAVSVVVAMAALAAFIGVIAWSTKSYSKYSVGDIKGNEVLTDIQKGPANSSILKHVTALVAGLALFFTAISGVSTSLKDKSWGEIVAISVLISSAIAAIALLVHVIGKSANTQEKVPNLKSNYAGIVSVIVAMSGYLTAISFSLLMIKDLNLAQMTLGLGAMASAMASLGVFIFLLTSALQKMGTTSELVVLSGSIMAISMSMSIILTTVAGMLWMLQDINWSKLDGSAGYLAGVLVFIGAMTAIIMGLSAFTTAGSVVASSVSILISMSVMLLAIAEMFDILGMVNWEGITGAMPFIKVILIAVIAIMAIATVLTMFGPEFALTAAAVISSMAAMFIGLGVLFVAVGYASSLLGDGVQKISDGLNTLFSIDYSKIGSVLVGIRGLIEGLAVIGALLSAKDILGALKFSIFIGIVAGAINKLTAVDPTSVEYAAKMIVTFFQRVSEGLKGNEDIIELMVRFAEALPTIATSIAISLVDLAIGGVGLVAFAFEMILFTSLMSMVGDNIGPSFQKLVDGIMAGAAAISEHSIALQVGMLVLASFGILITAVGASLIAGGTAMTIGTLLIYAAGSMLGTAIGLLVNSLLTGAAIISESSIKLQVGMLVLSSFGIMMAGVGAALIAGGGLFVVGAGLLAVGASLTNVAVKQFSNAVTVASTTCLLFVTNLRATVQSLYALTEEASGLGHAFAQLPYYIVQGFVQGMFDCMPSAYGVMEAFGGGVLQAFCDVLGIESPAKEFIKAAGNVIAGFCEGIGINLPSATETMANLANSVVTTFTNGTVDGMGAAGEDGSLSFLDGIQSMIAQYAPELYDLMGDLGTNSGDRYGTNFANAATVKMAEAFSAFGWNDWTVEERQAFGTSATDTNLNTAQVQAARAANARVNNENWRDVYTPVKSSEVDLGFIDIDQFFKEYSAGGGGTGGDYTSDLASSISGSSGSGSGINDASKGSAIGTGGSTVTNNNNTYNFVQNNYSPEPLDRSEIYQQTKNQLSSWYNFNLEKNLAR